MTQAITIDETADFPAQLLAFANGDPANTATGATLFQPIGDALGFLIGSGNRVLQGPDADTTINPDTYSRVKIGGQTNPHTYTISDPTGKVRYMRIYDRNGAGDTVTIEREDATQIAQFSGAGQAWLDIEWIVEQGFVLGWQATAWSGSNITVPVDP